MLIAASIVFYNNDRNDLKNSISSFINTKLEVKLFLIDNSENDELKEIVTPFNDKRLEYIFLDKNLGFGAAHNIGIKKAENIGAKYHLVLNPDTYFDKGNLEKLVEFMEQKNEIGLVTPKVFFPDGALQYNCKFLPTPFNLVFRRFLSKIRFLNFIDKTYNMIFTNYDKGFSVPYVSGCFMLFRTEVFNKIGYFDENFFMYLEDTDISRRCFEYFDNYFFPDAIIYHKWSRASYTDKKLQKIHIRSAIHYFNKYGWFIDKDRVRLNKKALDAIKMNEKRLD